MEIMGILNITTDSFSDGGAYINLKPAIAHAQKMIAQGAKIIDVGGQSSRPNSIALSVEEELSRILPVITALSGLNCQISVDTYQPEVASAAINAGAHIINDISGTNTAKVVAGRDVKLVVMHNRINQEGTPHARTSVMPYVDLIKDIIIELQQSIQKCLDAGVEAQQIIVDPGIGFAKTYADNISILNKLKYIRTTIGYPMLLATSRKRFLSTLINVTDPQQCDVATTATTLQAYLAGCDYVRVHDVKSTNEVLTVFEAIHPRHD